MHAYTELDAGGYVEEATDGMDDARLFEILIEISQNSELT